MIRLALPTLLLGLPLLAACNPPPPIEAHPRYPKQSIAEACREAATRVIVQRDRGELLREDEAGARLGTLQYEGTNLRAETDRLGRQFQRDRLANDCTRDNGVPQPNRPMPNGAPAGTLLPAPPPSTSAGD